MLSAESLQRELTVCRNEIANLRKSLRSISAQFKNQCGDIKNALEALTQPSTSTAPSDHGLLAEGEKESETFCFSPIGHIRTAFPSKNATPRQACICSHSTATLTIDKRVFNRPQHCLEGLEEFSHIWLLSVLDRNNRTESGSFAYRSKVHPPRLSGRSVGVFGTRSPHRPCPIGLSLVQLDAVKGKSHCHAFVVNRRDSIGPP